MVHLGTFGDIAQPVKPVVVIPPDVVEVGSCNETFTRVVADGWGTSEFGAEWQHELTGLDPVERSVDGSRAHFGAPAAETASAHEWVDTWPDGAPLPVEVLWTGLVINWSWDPDGWNLVLSLDSQPDPSGSGDYVLLGFVSRRTGTYGSHTLSLEAQLVTSEGSFAEAGAAPDPQLLPSGTLVNDAQYAPEMNVRLRVEAGAVRARIWRTSDPEPVDWTLEDESVDNSPLAGQLVSVGMQFFGFSNFGYATADVTLDDIAITEGCAV